MNFLKGLLTSCLGTLLALLALFFISIMAISGLVAAFSEDSQVDVKNNSVLHLKIDGQINEQQVDNPLAGLPIPGTDEQNIGLIQLKEAIDHAKDDPKISGIFLEIDRPITYYSTLQEIRQSLQDFKSSNKWIVAYNEVYSEGGYYLASVSDEVYMNPYGDVEFNGLTADFMSFKKMLDKLEIKPQVFRVGAFKSAVEPFLLEKMSDENRLQLTEMIGSIYTVMLHDVSESRHIEQARLKEISDDMLVRNAQDAVKFGLVDSLLYKDQFDAVIKSKVEEDDVNYIKYSEYQKSYTTSSGDKDEIAVLVAEGTIMPGKSNPSQNIIGGESFVEELRKARENDDIKAIVLRVNSPGGEPRASDMIWREVKLASAVKPVICSMGDLAASGGYYISMACDTIVAQENTITGSIGIFGIMFDMSGFLNNKIGITFDEVKTGNYGEMYTVTRPLTEGEKRIVQQQLDSFYDTFITKASEGRHVSKDAILAVAGGRVWTGLQAKDKGLVDVMGGINLAIEIAAGKANLDSYQVNYYPKRKPFFEEILSEMGNNVKMRALKSELGEQYTWYLQASKIKSYQGPQARLPFEFTIE